MRTRVLLHLLILLCVGLLFTIPVAAENIPEVGLYFVNREWDYNTSKYVYSEPGKYKEIELGAEASCDDLAYFDGSEYLPLTYTQSFSPDELSVSGSAITQPGYGYYDLITYRASATGESQIWYHNSYVTVQVVLPKYGLYKGRTADEDDILLGQCTQSDAEETGGVFYLIASDDMEPISKVEAFYHPDYYEIRNDSGVWSVSIKRDRLWYWEEIFIINDDNNKDFSEKIKTNRYSFDIDSIFAPGLYCKYSRYNSSTNHYEFDNNYYWDVDISDSSVVMKGIGNSLICQLAYYDGNELLPLAEIENFSVMDITVSKKKDTLAPYDVHEWFYYDIERNDLILWRQDCGKFDLTYRESSVTIEVILPHYGIYKGTVAQEEDFLGSTITIYGYEGNNFYLLPRTDAAPIKSVEIKGDNGSDLSSCLDIQVINGIGIVTINQKLKDFPDGIHCNLYVYSEDQEYPYTDRYSFRYCEPGLYCVSINRYWDSSTEKYQKILGRDPYPYNSLRYAISSSSFSRDIAYFDGKNFTFLEDIPDFSIADVTLSDPSVLEVTLIEDGTIFDSINFTVKSVGRTDIIYKGTALSVEVVLPDYGIYNSQTFDLDNYILEYYDNQGTLFVGTQDTNHTILSVTAKKYPSYYDIEYENGYWKITLAHDAVGDWSDLFIVELNDGSTKETNRVSFSIEKQVSCGDTNGDDEITSDDAIYLLYYSLLPELYPINQECDFDGNGEVNSDDAIYLLYYTLLPELYPLK